MHGSGSWIHPYTRRGIYIMHNRRCTYCGAEVDVGAEAIYQRGRGMVNVCDAATLDHPTTAVQRPRYLWTVTSCWGCNDRAGAPMDPRSLDFPVTHYSGDGGLTRRVDLILAARGKRATAANIRAAAKTIELRMVTQTDANAWRERGRVDYYESHGRMYRPGDLTPNEQYQRWLTKRQPCCGRSHSAGCDCNDIPF